MEAYLDWQSKSGGIKLNDVIEEYRYVAAGNQIKAGDLVNYINGIAGNVDYGESVDTQLSTETNSGYTISAVQLDDNRVFIAHSYGANLYLYGVVVTIDGAAITYGSDKKLSTTNYTGFAISAIRLKENKVFIAHSHTNGYQLYGMLCTITDSIIKVETDIELASNKYQGYFISSLALDENRVFIAHSYTSNDYLYGMVVTIDGTTITKGTDTSIHSSTYTSTRMSMCLLPNGNVFIAHSSNSSFQLYATLVSISNTTITKGTVAELSTVTNSGNNISVCLLASGKIFIAHGYGSDKYLYGMVVTISGTKITAGTDTVINSSIVNSGSTISTTLLPNGNVLVAHSYNSNMYLCGVVCAVNGTTIEVGNDTALNTNDYAGEEITSLLLKNGSIFTAHSRSQDKYLYAQLVAIDKTNNIPTNNIVITEYETQVTPAIEPPFNAIALSSGVGGTDTEHKDQVKIARVYKEVAETGNIFPTTWTKVTEGTKYSSADGYILEASSYYNYNFYLYYACDGVSDRTSAWKSKAGISSWVKMTLPEATKITKMKTYMVGSATDEFASAVIQGSKNGTDWIDLYEIKEEQTEFTEITLNNPDYYQYYKILFNLKDDTSKSVLYEWQTSEYMEVIQ